MIGNFDFFLMLKQILIYILITNIIFRIFFRNANKKRNGIKFCGDIFFGN